MAGETTSREAAVVEEDMLRAHVYALLARFLSAPPSAETLSLGAALTGDDTDLGKAVGTLAELCQRIEVHQANDEYHDLFIGVGRGELLPYCSYYLTGFLNEKPLSKLRNDMQKFGIEPNRNVAEPEDHIASICEMMAGLIRREFGKPATLADQKEFFETHLSPWGGHFFRDLGGAKASVLYAGIAVVGQAFLDIEKNGFSML